MNQIHSYPQIDIPNIGTLRKGLLLVSEPLFWLHYQREVDRQDFIAELTQNEILKLLEAGGVQLIHMKAAVDRDGNWRKREVRL